MNALANIVEIDLVVTGRKSGRTSSRLVWFVLEQGKLYLLPVAGSETNWYKNVIVNPTVQITVLGKTITAMSIPITEPKKVEEVVEKFRRKHGPDEVTKYYTNLNVAVEVPL